MLCTMCEGIGRAPLLESRKHGVMGDTAKRHDHRETGEGGDLRLKENPAGLDLLRRRLVFGRHTANRIGDQCIRQHQPVIGSLGILTSRKAETAKR